MHYFTKFGLAASALVLSGVVAIRSGTAGLVQRAALLSAAILTGALLALITITLLMVAMEKPKGKNEF